MTDENEKVIVEDYRSYYYYEKEDIKVDVNFHQEEDETVKRTTSKFLLRTYPADIAEKVRERLTWKKFGQPPDDKITRVSDEVFFEINPALKNYYFKKQPENPNLNKKIYYENPLSKHLFSKTNTKKEEDEPLTYSTPDFVCAPKKSVVNCRHCGSPDHWSVKCAKLISIKEDKHDDKDGRDNRDNRDGKHSQDKDKRDFKSNKLPGLKLYDVDPTLSDNDIKAHLSKYGRLVNFYNVKNSKYEANSIIYISFSTQEENDNALEKIKTEAIGYTYAHVEVAKPKNN